MGWIGGLFPTIGYWSNFTSTAQYPMRFYRIVAP